MHGQGKKSRSDMQVRGGADPRVLLRHSFGGGLTPDFAVSTHTYRYIPSAKRIMATLAIEEVLMYVKVTRVYMIR